MSKPLTNRYADIAASYSLWIDYVDTDAVMTEAEFHALSIEQKIAMQVEAFGEVQNHV